MKSAEVCAVNTYLGANFVPAWCPCDRLCQTRTSNSRAESVSPGVADEFVRDTSWSLPGCRKGGFPVSTFKIKLLLLAVEPRNRGVLLVFWKGADFPSVCDAASSHSRAPQKVPLRQSDLKRTLFNCFIRIIRLISAAVSLKMFYSQRWLHCVLIFKIVIIWQSMVPHLSWKEDDAPFWHFVGYINNIKKKSWLMFLHTDTALGEWILFLHRAW